MHSIVDHSQGRRQQHRLEQTCHNWMLDVRITICPNYNMHVFKLIKYEM